MDPAFACVQSRLDSFAAPKSKSRRTSSRSRKVAPKTAPKAAWSLRFPSPYDLAFAGFVWKPTSTSPDNVQCFNCNCQLDGWEETDVPAYEHLTHSPECGFAVNICIRLRSNDPGRTEDDPLSDVMLNARRQTFADLWPLDTDAGFPSVDQMVAAGWYYDPSTDTPDGVTCPYCSLSLDAWDAGDDPMEEHRKRASDCLFFTLKDLYHAAPTTKVAKGKRSSTRSSTASTRATKTQRVSKKRATKEDLSRPLPPTPDTTTLEDITAISGVEATAESGIEVTAMSEIEAPPKATRRRKTTKRASAMSTLEDATAMSEVEVVPKATRGRKAAKRTSAISAIEDATAVSEVEMAPKATRTRQAPKRVSAASTTSTASRPRGRPKRTSTTSNTSTTKTSRGKKRTSEHMDLDDQPEESPKRTKFLDSLSSDMPDSMLESTQLMSPRERNSDVRVTEATSSEAAALESTTPKSKTPQAKTPVVSPPSLRTPEAQTPEAKTPGARSFDSCNSFWEPANIDSLFEKKEESLNLLSHVMVDAGLDQENIDVGMDYTPEGLAEAVKTALTGPEKRMTIEEWVMYNAKRGEDKLRMECDQQVAAFETESRRALAALDNVPVIGV